MMIRESAGDCCEEAQREISQLTAAVIVRHAHFAGRPTKLAAVSASG